jgi:LEA14-like dessication related protein
LIFTKNTNENRTDISVGNLQAGMYILKVKTSAGMAVKRIMKQ